MLDAVVVGPLLPKNLTTLAEWADETRQALQVPPPDWWCKLMIGFFSLTAVGSRLIHTDQNLADAVAAAALVGGASAYVMQAWRGAYDQKLKREADTKAAEAKREAEAKAEKDRRARIRARGVAPRIAPPLTRADPLLEGDVQSSEDLSDAAASIPQDAPESNELEELTQRIMERRDGE